MKTKSTSLLEPSEASKEPSTAGLAQAARPRHFAARTGWKFPVLLFVFALAVFWKLVFVSQYSILTYPDSAFQTYPWSQYLAQVIHQGSFPFWDNYADAGRSFIGETQTGAFYPFNLLMAAFPLNARGLLPVSVIEGFIILHCFLASLFMYGLARHFQLSPFSACVAGIVFAYGGSVGMRTSAQVNLFYASIWVPAIFWSYSKSLQAEGWQRQLFFANLGGLALALSLLAGHHQPFIYSSLALAGIAAFLAVSHLRDDRRHELFCKPRVILRQTLLLFLFAIAYAGVQLLPSLEYAPLAYRWVDSVNPSLVSDRIPYSIVGLDNALPPHGFLLMLFPYFSKVENSPYLGILPLLLISLALGLAKKNRIVRFASVLALLCATLAMGYFSPLHGLFYALIPGFDKGREAGRIFLLAHFALSLLAGFGCQTLCHPIGRRQRPWSNLVVKSFCLLSLLLCLILLSAYVYQVQVLGHKADYGALGFASLLLLATSALGLGRLLSWSKPRSIRIAIVFILLFDFHFFVGAHIKPKNNFDRKFNFEPKQYYQSDEVIQFLRSRTGVFRIDFRDEYYPRNVCEVFQLETVNGYGATSLKQFYEFQAEAYPPGNVIADLLNVKYVVSQQELEMPMVFQNQKAKVYENPGALPRAWLARQAVRKQNFSEMLPLLREPSFDPRAVIYLENTAIRDPDSTASALTAISVVPELAAGGSIPAFTRISPNRFIVESDETESEWLVVSQNWYPGWKAKVDGRSAIVERAYGALLAVWIGPGKHRVEFRYRPTHFYTAMGLLLPALLVLAVTGWRTRVGRR
jgi:hypothetical protein